MHGSKDSRSIALNPTGGIGLEQDTPALGHAHSRSARSLPEKLLILSFIGDTCIVFCALILAWAVRFYTPVINIGVRYVQPSIFDYLGHIAFGGATLTFALVYGGLYDRKHLLSFRRAFNIYGRSSLVWLLGYIAISLILKFQPDISRIYCLLGYAFFILLMGAWRGLFHLAVTRENTNGGSLRMRVAFVGWNESASQLASSIRTDTRHLYDVAGFFQAPKNDDPKVENAHFLGEFDKIENVVASGEIDIVLLAHLELEKDEILKLANLCEKELVEFKVIPSYFQILLSGLHLEHVSGVPVLGIDRLPLQSPANVYLKRVLDIFGALVGLAVSAPLIAIFGALVQIESRGPVFYRQRRLGRNGKPFDMFKLRTMRIDSEAESGPRWTSKDDPRVLRVGKFMRKFNIDEVPQFLNVLKSEMSLVGPRPERPEFITHFKEQIPHYNARHNIKPGITGWAQVNGLRGDTDLAERVRYDLYYIENWSLLLDFQIMLLTFSNRENAY